MEIASRPRRFATIANHLGEHNDGRFAHTMPIFQTSTFGFVDAQDAGEVMSGEAAGRYVYTRGGNPNARLLAAKIAHLEGLDLIAEAPDKDPASLVAGEVTASGLAAIASVALTFLSAGDTAIVQAAAYGGALSFWDTVAPRYGIKPVFVHGAGMAAWQRAVAEHPQAQLLYIETPSTPLLHVYDLRALADLAHSIGALCVVDNTASTPFLQRPLSFGADYVVHSTTKYINGHGLMIGGAIATRHVDAVAVGGELWHTVALHGATPSPHDCWLANNGLKTLALRMQQHTENALRMAQYLASHPAIARVHYPGLPSSPFHELARRQMPRGFGGLVSFEVAGGGVNALALLRRLRIPIVATSFGTTDTLIQHTDTMSHSYMTEEHKRASGITPALLRMSVGIEAVEDLLDDFEQALRGLGR